MKRVLKAPPRLTKEEIQNLKQCIHLFGWHFDDTIKRNCTEIEKYCIRWTGEDWKTAVVYGLKAIKKETEESCIANLFIRYEGRLYQTQSLQKLIVIIDLLRKEEKFNEYEDKLSDLKYKQRQKLMAQKQKVNIQKLKVVTKKKAA